MIDRGDIWWASMREPEDSGPGGRRPVLVIQADSFNDSGLATTIVAVFTTQLKWADAPGNVLVPARDSGLSRDSVVNVSQLIALDRSSLTERVGSLGPWLMRQVDDGLRKILDL